jgi:hypothetical protein
MALSFTGIPDKHGPAVYIFGDGTSQLEKRLIDFGEEVDKLTPDETQVVYLEPSRGDGLRVKEFYALSNFPVTMIIMDDDTVYHMWESNIPQPDQVSYFLSQINGHITQ